MDPLDVQAWMRSHPPEACISVHRSPPEQLGEGWSKQGEHCTFPSSEAGGGALPALTLPQLPCNLDNGIDKFVPKRADAKAGVEIVVRAALAAGAVLRDCDVLTFRNNLNKVLGTPHNPESAWTIDGVLQRRTLFLDIVQQPENWESGADQQRFVAWGYNFEAICTGQAVADANTESGMLLRTQLGQQRIYMGAEMDCYDPAACQQGSPPGLAAVRELKTYRQPQHPGQWRTVYRWKHPKWWVQSHLAGVAALVLGARDDQGIVHRIDVVPTDDLPELSRRFGERWSPQQALAFGADCLAWMKNAAAQQEGLHVRFSYDPASSLVRTEVVHNGGLPARLAEVLPAAGS